MFLPQEFIRKKRDRQPLDQHEIDAFVRSVADGSLSEGQVAAFAMAVFFNDMSLDERVALTLALRDSGQVLDWRSMNLDGPVVDKHSTGGVGDLTSLLLGPMVAACGAYVPMISGRGLGHTGGTLDKLEAIPGYRVTPSTEAFMGVVRDVGVAIIGQTTELAPADKRIYAIRDITATVDSVAMITASILSKKLAGGIDALVMDVKVGNGAFMPTLDRARELADSLVKVGRGAGMRTSALLTDMNQSLAPSAGNALEIACAIDYLTGAARPARLHQVTLALAAQMLVLGGLAADETQAQAKLLTALDSGAAAERFAKMVASLGGPSDLLERPGAHLGAAAVRLPIAAPLTGQVERIDCRALGIAVVELGGGRRRAEDLVDPHVGLSDLAELGQRVVAGQPLGFVHARTVHEAEQVAGKVQRAYTLSLAGSPVPPTLHPVVQ